MVFWVRCSAGLYLFLILAFFLTILLKLYEDMQGLRSNDGLDLKLSSVSLCQVVIFGWSHRGPTSAFITALVFCVSLVIYIAIALFFSFAFIGFL